ncbi:hypothetical protein MNV49_005332 [Pseudohyphozyma bogoriensis]|nr:hypothetical protein MNV49_005332 [Pseudohyphozyma bogoriensis]
MAPTLSSLFVHLRPAMSSIRDTYKSIVPTRRPRLGKNRARSPVVQCATLTPSTPSTLLWTSPRTIVGIYDNLDYEQDDQLWYEEQLAHDDDDDEDLAIAIDEDGTYGTLGARLEHFAPSPLPISIDELIWGMEAMSIKDADEEMRRRLSESRQLDVDEQDEHLAQALTTALADFSHPSPAYHSPSPFSTYSPSIYSTSSCGSLPPSPLFERHSRLSSVSSFESFTTARETITTKDDDDDVYIASDDYDQQQQQQQHQPLHTEARPYATATATATFNEEDEEEERERRWNTYHQQEAYVGDDDERTAKRPKFRSDECYEEELEEGEIREEELEEGQIREEGPVAKRRPTAMEVMDEAEEDRAEDWLSSLLFGGGSGAGRRSWC